MSDETAEGGIHGSEAACRYRAVPRLGSIRSPGEWRDSPDDAHADARLLGWKHGGEWRVEAKAA